MIIELRNITKTYYNSDSTIAQDVLTGIDLILNEGQAISVVGPSGCGKSTLLNIIGTVDIPTSGMIKFGDTELNNMSDNSLAAIRNQDIGFVFQSHHLFPQLNVLENILVPTIPVKGKEYKKEALKRAKSLIDKVGLSDKINQLPGELSGGECQRVAVIRALINKPKIILADEPTGSLDEKSAEHIGKLLSDINLVDKVAMVVVTHSMKLANKIGNIHTLTNGKLIMTK